MSKIKKKSFSIKINFIVASTQHFWDFSCSFNSFDINICWRFFQSPTKEFSSFSLSLCFDQNLLGFLFSPFNNIFCSLCLLLSNLFIFNSFCKLTSENQISNWHIIKYNIEVKESFSKSLFDQIWYLVSLGQKIRGIVLCYNWFCYFIGDWWQYSLIIVCT